jgi:hypothetical protein
MLDQTYEMSRSNELEQQQKKQQHIKSVKETKVILSCVNLDNHQIRLVSEALYVFIS